MPTPKDVIAIAEGEIGYSRWSDPKEGTKYGRWYAEQSGEDWYGTNGIAYCAMFASWVFAKANVKCAGLPGAYCPTMLMQAREDGATVRLQDARAGDVVYFDWGSDGESDHVGIITANRGSYYETIEGNTSDTSSGSQSNGGVVARKSRNLSTVCGVVRPYYDGSGAAQETKQLEVTGVLRKEDVAEWQRQCGTYVDGVVTGQLEYCKELWPALEAIDDYNGEGSALMRRVQEIVGVSGPTGIAARGTICMIQGWLVLNGYTIGSDVAGHLQEGTAKAIQTSLNDGTWMQARLRL